MKYGIKEQIIDHLTVPVIMAINVLCLHLMEWMGK